MTVADPVGFDASRFAGAFSVSAAGLVTYRSASGGIRRQLTWFDRSGKVVGTVGAPDENNLLDPALSPDGRRVAVDRTVQGNTDIWIIDGVPHHALHVRRERRHLSHVVAGREPDRVPFESEGCEQLLPEGVERRRQRGIAFRVAAKRNRQRLVA